MPDTRQIPEAKKGEVAGDGATFCGDKLYLINFRITSCF